MLNDFYQFLHMGGYAKFIWPAYGFSFFILALSIYLPWRERKKILGRLK